MQDSKTVSYIDNTVLVVDDQPQNIKLIGTLLRNDFHLLIADSGEKAIITALERKPDLILLDIMMPEMSGFETCISLKKHDSTKDIPIIFLTAKTETEDIVHAFEIGGVDYITKPFRSQEVIARIKTHLDLKNSKDVIKKQNSELAEKNIALEKFQTELEKRNADLQTAYTHLEIQSKDLNKMYSQIIESEHFLQKSNDELCKMNEEKNKFFSIISHDLRSPFAGILTMTELLTQHLDSFTKDELVDLFDSMNQQAQTTYKLIEDMLDWSRSQMGRIQVHLEHIDLSEVVFDLLNTLVNIAGMKNIQLNTHIAMNTFVNCDRNMIATVIRNIITNAVKFTNSGGEVNIKSEFLTVENSLRFCRIAISDTGVGMTEEQLDNIFELGGGQSTFGTNNEKGSGLGLVISRDFVAKHHGRIWAESQVGAGSTFYVEIPVE